MKNVPSIAWHRTGRLRDALLPDARRREARWALLFPASRRSSSRSSAWGWTTSSRSKQRKRGLVPPSTARAAPSATTSRPSAAPGRWPSCGPDAGTRAASSRRSTPPATRSFTCSRSRATGVSRCCLPDTNVFARRVPIPLFGAGLVEAIPDETLLALEDPQDRNGDGVSGRAGLIIDVDSGERRVGRFGWKAQHATLMTFGADAYRNEMGITNDLFPHESAFGITPEQMRLCDPFPDPEDFRDPRTRRRGIDNFASFMRFLAPAGRERHQRPGSGGRAGLRRNRLHHLPRADPRDRTERQSALPSEDSRAVFRSAAP